MSHFTVLCIGDDIESQLYPFCELECSLTREEIEKDPRAKFKFEYTTEELKKKYEETLNKHPEYNYNTLEEFADDYYGYKKLEDKDEWGYWTNTNAEWDWYTVGGRWTGFFKIKDNPTYPSDIIVGSPGLMIPKCKEGYADSLRKCDIDFEGMKKDKLESLSKTWKEIREKIESGSKSVYTMYDIDENDTEETFINDRQDTATYAFIKDGQWVGKGNMGWFGISSNEKENWNAQFNKMIESLPDDTLLTVVDCHI